MKVVIYAISRPPFHSYDPFDQVLLNSIWQRDEFLDRGCVQALAYHYRTDVKEETLHPKLPKHH